MVRPKRYAKDWYFTVSIYDYSKISEIRGSRKIKENSDSTKSVIFQSVCLKEQNACFYQANRAFMHYSNTYYHYAMDIFKFFFWNSKYKFIAYFLFLQKQNLRKWYAAPFPWRKSFLEIVASSCRFPVARPSHQHVYAETFRIVTEIEQENINVTVMIGSIPFSRISIPFSACLY